MTILVESKSKSAASQTSSPAQGIAAAVHENKAHFKKVLESKPRRNTSDPITVEEESGGNGSYMGH
jgi:hypothetical protein